MRWNIEGPRYRGAMLAMILLLAAACASGAESPGDGNAEPTSGESAGETEAAAEPRKIVLGTASTPVQADGAMYSSIPLELGYWEEEGLEVEILPFAGAADALAALDAGQVDIVTGGTSTWFSGTATGDLNAVAFCQHFTGFLNAPYALESSGIRTVEDMAGARIAVAALTGSSVPLLETMLRDAGVDPSSVTFVPTGVGADVLAAVERGSVDVLGLFDGPHGRVAAAGYPIVRIPTSLDRLTFTGALFAREETVEEDRDMLVRFARGYAKAATYMHENPEAGIKIHWDYYPDTKPLGVEDEEALERELSVVALRLENMEPIDDLWCNSKREDVETFSDILVETGQLESGPDIDRWWTNDLTADINDFDPEPYLQAARDYS